MGFELLLFSTDVEYVREGVRAGIDGIVVDWEYAGKTARQAGADTQISRDTVEDLRRVRRATDAPVICRINHPALAPPDEVDAAVKAGADELLVPMVRSADELHPVLERAAGRCRVGVLIETPDAVADAWRIGQLPLSRVYVGLNDLAIERGTPSIFDALIDGTVDAVRPHIAGRFGVGGLTRPELGQPVPCRVLVAEMARLRSDFTFLRRSYRRDVPPGEQAGAVAAIRQAIAEAGRDRPVSRSAVADALRPRLAVPHVAAC